MVYKAIPHSQHRGSTPQHGLANIIILKKSLKSYNEIAMDPNEKEMRLS